MSDLCPTCGKSHPSMTACPYGKKSYFLPEDVAPSMLESPIEKKLNKIIEFLEKIEYYLRTLK